MNKKKKYAFGGSEMTGLMSLIGDLGSFGNKQINKKREGGFDANTVGNTLSMVGGIAGMIPGGQPIGLGVSAIGQLISATNQPQPPKVINYNNSNPYGFAMGGSLNALSSNAVEVDADNPEMSDSVEIGNIALDDDEVVVDDKVFSNSLYGADGKMFSKKAKKIQKAKGNFEKNIRQKLGDEEYSDDLYYDKETERTFEKQEQLAQKLGLRDQEGLPVQFDQEQGFKFGGSMKGMKYKTGGMLKYFGGGPIIGDPTGRRNSVEMDQANVPLDEFLRNPLRIRQTTNTPELPPIVGDINPTTGRQRDGSLDIKDEPVKWMSLPNYDFSLRPHSTPEFDLEGMSDMKVIEEKLRMSREFTDPFDSIIGNVRKGAGHFRDKDIVNNVANQLGDATTETPKGLLGDLLSSVFQGGLKGDPETMQNIKKSLTDALLKGGDTNETQDDADTEEGEGLYSDKFLPGTKWGTMGTNIGMVSNMAGMMMNKQHLVNYADVGSLEMLQQDLALGRINEGEQVAINNALQQGRGAMGQVEGRSAQTRNANLRNIAAGTTQNMGQVRAQFANQEANARLNIGARRTGIQESNRAKDMKVDEINTMEKDNQLTQNMQMADNMRKLMIEHQMAQNKLNFNRHVAANMGTRNFGYNFNTGQVEFIGEGGMSPEAAKMMVDKENRETSSGKTKRTKKKATKTTTN